MDLDQKSQTQVHKRKRNGSDQKTGGGGVRNFRKQ